MQPSIPHHAQQQHPQQHSQTVAYGVVEALRNPYAQAAPGQFHSPYSLHYLQSQQSPYTTPEGYTLSSTYNPNMQTHSYDPRTQGQSFSGRGRGRGRGVAHRPSTNPSRPSTQPSGSWYQTGSSHCTYSGCKFIGSPKSVEIHMMDRHLIYPPGWHKNTKGSSWDADLSLKGKTIPIQGTSLVLDTPEALDAWLAERKKRWPTAGRVEDEKIKREKAIAQGQLPFTSSGGGIKRRREEDTGLEYQRKKGRFNKSETSQRKNPPQTAQVVSGKVQDSRPDGTAVPPPPSNQGKQSHTTIQKLVGYPDNEDSSDDDAPESVSSKQPVGPVAPPAVTCAIDTEKTQSDSPLSKSLPGGSRNLPKPRKKEPRLTPRNPFASRPTLLRNLLLPEIRMTVSNLSQAIRFLVDNNFLQDVELEPGQANHNPIEVLGSQPAEPIHKLHD